MNTPDLKNIEPSRSPAGSPQLSVVIASDHSIGEVDRCLKALVKQRENGTIEIIVADARADDSVKDVMARYPDVAFIRFPEKTTLPILWGAGIQRSQGEIIAIADSTCVASDNWIAAILKAHESAHPVIGGAVEAAAEGRNALDWAAYFCEYGQFMRPLAEGPADVLSGNNIAFKRWTLTRGQQFVENGFWKTYWCRQLQGEGIGLVSTPAMVIYDKKSYRLFPFLVRRFHHARCFAGMRVSQISVLKRLFYIVGLPILPFVFLVRLISAIVPKKRHLTQFIISLPISFLAILAWSAGEMFGYLKGPGNSCAYIY